MPKLLPNNLYYPYPCGALNKREVTERCDYLVKQISQSIKYNSSQGTNVPFMIWFNAGYNGTFARVDIEALPFQKVSLIFHGMNKKRNEDGDILLEDSLDPQQRVGYNKQVCALFKALVIKELPEISHIGFRTNSGNIVIKDFLEGVKAIPTHSPLHLEIGEIFDYDPLYLPEFSAHPNIKVFRFGDELGGKSKVVDQEGEQVKLGEVPLIPEINYSDPAPATILEEVYIQPDNIEDASLIGEG
ncbi:hypothetical protein [Candidatus Tisiphia endosymbiont of Beris chalybata]|uniref:hypothetical protein n=1 Tax=Candidatus Tisiphia endosymbiont of Beris chalybata TaxID=3066262 RepID=UPI00312C89D4